MRIKTQLCLLILLFSLSVHSSLAVNIVSNPKIAELGGTTTLTSSKTIYYDKDVFARVLSSNGSGTYPVDEIRLDTSYKEGMPSILAGNPASTTPNEPNICNKKAADSFNYSANSNINGANGGSGFNQSWKVTSSMNGSVKVLSGSLDFPGHQSSGNKVRIALQDEKSTTGFSRTFSQPFKCGTEVWINCLIRPIDLAEGGFWIRPNGRQDIAVGKKWGTEISINNTGTGISVEKDKVAKLVVRYKLENTQTVVHLWVNRNDNFTDENANSTRTISETIPEINNILVAMEKWGNGTFEIDEMNFSCYEAPSDNAGNGNVCQKLLPQQANFNLGGKRILIIRGVDPATHTWINTDDELEETRVEMDKYWKQNSFGRTWIEEFELTPVYEFTVPAEGLGYSGMSRLLQQKAIQNGYILSNYDIVGYIHQSSTDFGGAGALGIGNGIRGEFWANNNLTWFFKGNIHEMFHSLGVGHAEGIEGEEVMYPGTVPGGADPYHFMGSEGNGGLNSDIPNYMKYYLGWIDPENVSCVADGFTECTIKRIYKTTGEVPFDADKKYAIQVGKNLWLSYEPDNTNTQIVTKGVLLHYVPGPGSGLSRILDTRPNSITILPPGVSSAYHGVKDFWDAAMEVGDKVEWEGLTIQVLKVGGTGTQKWVDIEIKDKSSNCPFESPAPDCQVGASCDDDDPCTIGDYLDEYCNCVSDVISQDKAQIKLYPNPTKDWVNFEGDLEKITSISVLNSTGQIVMQSITSNILQEGFSVSNLPSGLYLVHLIQLNQKAIIKRIVVE